MNQISELTIKFIKLNVSILLCKASQNMESFVQYLISLKTYFMASKFNCEWNVLTTNAISLLSVSIYSMVLNHAVLPHNTD